MVHAECECCSALIPRMAHCRRRRGFSTISPDEREIAISNLSTSIEVYSLESLTKIRSFTDNVNYPNNDINQALSVEFMRNGTFVVGGSFTGHIRILDKASGVTVQTLHYDNSECQLILPLHASRINTGFLVYGVRRIAVCDQYLLCG